MSASPTFSLQAIRMVNDDVPDDELVALMAQGHTFIVSKSILSTWSPIFRGLLNRQTGGYSQAAKGVLGKEDDLPVLSVDDSPREVEPFLRAIFDSRYLLPGPISGNTLLRYLGDLEVGDIPHGYYPDHLQFHLTVIHVLHEVQAMWLLPAAYYAAVTGFHAYLVRVDTPYRGVWVDQCVTLVAFFTESTQRVHAALSEESSCAFGRRCDQAKFWFLQDCGGDWHANLLSPDCLDELVKKLCQLCAAEAIEEHRAIRTEMGQILPVKCELQDWDTLLNKRRAVMAS
ncbi:hypothetical protein B0H16DRAFT_1717382 [Mycena metata]|uniref:BTB domain-containing protein n=1 Tax=Mycena metata TaxID=1033252 RepID=A0AAD7NLP2_9AGAR|nr:hypothetical protein B0H16DRAFT_1717382 [Mycena metata]